MPDFPTVFQELKSILEPYAETLDVVHDTDENFYLNTHHIMKNNEPMYFGSTNIKKRYVSFYLMPVYENPALLDDISEGLKKRMQGKSCFNFTKVDETLFEELKQLVARGYASYQEQGYVTEANPATE